ncbi:hypothetical protein ACFQAS_06915 [Halopenitus salinus]|jgi:hypothetical protein|uniref:Uncharacterized protein n=1 Tax=Halopenitus salinus TaxID=1198295 RepID=A0ABD5UYS0_9EURY
MDDRTRLYVSGFIAATIAYVTTVLAFAGRFAIFEWIAFVIAFLVVFVGFDRFVVWLESQE